MGDTIIIKTLFYKEKSEGDVANISNSLDFPQNYILTDISVNFSNDLNTHNLTSFPPSLPIIGYSYIRNTKLNHLNMHVTIVHILIRPMI